MTAPNDEQPAPAASTPTRAAMRASTEASTGRRYGGGLGGRRRWFTPRVTDWSLALAGAAACLSGIVSLVSGQPGEWPVFAFHGAAGLWLLLLLAPKLRRVWPRLTRQRLWNRHTMLGVLATLVVELALGSGIWWVAGGDISLVGFGLLNWHIMLGFALGLRLATHTGDEPLAYEHGAPARLVAPGRRGFEWVKWLVRVEVLTAPDYGELLAIHTSWLTPAGRGVG
ncbi:MAG TPA: molybdopterin-dependent oxidoreductase [Ktedonobacterales bacterium]|nr:molybdopterin-dependent oxidoreductase [Ktedonobacterales bacterium]